MFLLRFNSTLVEANIPECYNGIIAKKEAINTKGEK